MAMKTKAAIKKANKKKVQRVPPSKVKSWKMDDLKKMEEIIMSAPSQVLGQKLAAEHFGATYASIQCRWSRYKRGQNMGRIKKKKVRKMRNKPYMQSQVPQILKKEMSASPVAGKEILDMITIKTMKVNKDQRTIIIHY